MFHLVIISIFTLLNVERSVKLLTPGAFRQKRIFLHVLEIFSLEMRQIGSDLLKKAFATQQHAFLSTGIEFYNIFVQAWKEIKISSTGSYRLTIRLVVTGNFSANFSLAVRASTDFKHLHFCAISSSIELIHYDLDIIGKIFPSLHQDTY